MKFRSLLLLTSLITCFLFAPLATHAATLSRAPNNLGLVAYYPLNEGVGTRVGDMSGNRNDGDITTATWTTGKYSKALKFDGTNDLVTIPDSPSLDIGNTGSVSAWVRLDANNRWNSVLAKNTANSDTLNNYSLEINLSNQAKCLVANGSASNIVYSSALSGTGVYYHIVCVWDGANVTVYINGAYDNSVAQTITPAGNANPLYIGQYGGGTDRMQGVIDDVRIYNRALSATEVSKLYQSGSVVVNKVTSVGSGSANCASSNSCSITYSATTGNMLVVSGRSLDATDSGILSVTDNVGNTYIQALNTKFFGNHIAFAYYVCSPKSGVTTINVNVTTASEIATEVLEYSGMANVNCFDQVSTVNNNTGDLIATTTTLTPTRSGELSIGVFQHTTNASQAFSDSSGYTCVNRFDTQDGDTTAQCYKSLASAVPVQAYAAHALGGNQWWAYQLLFKPASLNANHSQNVTGGTLDNGLVGLWSFNGADMNWNTNKALDRSGNGNDGTLTNLPTTTSAVPGRVGQALKFTNDSYVNVGTPSSFNNLTTMTLSAWINPNSYGVDTRGRIIDKDSNSFGWTMNIAGDGDSFCSNGTNVLVFVMDMTGGPANRASWCTPANSVLKNTWTHVVVTFDRSSASNNPLMYINGQSVTVTNNEAAVGSVYDDSALPLYIGDRTTLDRSFDGKIDEARIYNRILSADEIKLLYNMGH